MALNIRPVESRDIQTLLIMARAMHLESPRYRGMKFIARKAIAMIEMLISRGGGFVAEKDNELIGMVGGILVEHFFSTDTFVCDVVVYVTPEHRGGSTVTRLVKALEKWGFDKGASEISLGVSTGIEPERTVRVYEHLGYKMATYSLLKTRDCTDV